MEGYLAPPKGPYIAGISWSLGIDVVREFINHFTLNPPKPWIRKPKPIVSNHSDESFMCIGWSFEASETTRAKHVPWTAGR